MNDEQPVEDDRLYVALVVAVPKEYFSDDDDICLQAAKYVCARLEQQLVRAGHRVEEWTKGGCAEDWGVYYESTFQNGVFQYAIHFFPDERGPEQRLIAVQFNHKPPRSGFLKWLFGKPSAFRAARSLQGLMELLGREFEEYRMLTKAQFDREY